MQVWLTIFLRDYGNIEQNETLKVFGARYNICKLVYFKGFEIVNEAIKWEKFIKGKNRKW